MTDPALEGRRGGLYPAVVVIALAVVVYCAFLMAGFVFKLLFLAGAVAIGVMAWRAWRSS